MGDDGGQERGISIGASAGGIVISGCKLSEPATAGVWGGIFVGGGPRLDGGIFFGRGPVFTKGPCCVVAGLPMLLFMHGGGASSSDWVAGDGEPSR